METDNFKIIDLTPENIADYGVCGYKDVSKHLQLQRKIEWFTNYYPKGLRIKALITKTGGYQGMLEYIPGEFAHRPVKAGGYMFIHCVFVGFNKETKGKGYASKMLDTCIEESKAMKMNGIAVVTRKSSFMADNTIFLKKGFQVVDKAKPDFELLVLKFNEKAENPCFNLPATNSQTKGLQVYRSPQCPYSVKNVASILETAKKQNIPATLIEMDNAESAQQSPCAFGTFCITHNGKIISHHPISNTRFENILKTLKK